jgi:hypothetical protein
LNDSQLSLAFASLVSALLLSSPFIGIEWANRLIALSFVPLLIAAMVIWLASEQLGIKITIGVLAVITLTTSVAFAFMGVKQSMISTDQYQDLVNFSEEFEVPENSIVVAPHGVEFLVAWHEKTFVLQDSSYEEEDLSSYDSVYYLKSTGGKAGPGGLPDFGNKPPMNGDQPPMNGDQPPMNGDKPPVMGDKSPVEITGDEVYKNDSYTLLKVR